MSPDEMFQEAPVEAVTDKDREMWPQARGELLGFALNLERRGMGITAAQLRLAVKLADGAAKPGQ